MSTITIRQLGMTERATVMIFWFTVIGTIATGLAMPFFFRPHDGVTWLMLIGAGVLGTLGQTFVTSALRYAPVALLAPSNIPSCYGRRCLAG